MFIDRNAARKTKKNVDVNHILVPVSTLETKMTCHIIF